MLTLPIKKQWYDMILSGVKKEEYREIKPYYTTRFQKLVAPYLQTPDGFWDRQWFEECRCRWYDDETFEVRLRNGYSANAPSCVVRVSVSIGYGKEEWGAAADCEYYVLSIKEILGRRQSMTHD